MPKLTVEREPVAPPVKRVVIELTPAEYDAFREFCGSVGGSRETPLYYAPVKEMPSPQRMLVRGIIDAVWDSKYTGRKGRTGQSDSVSDEGRSSGGALR